MPPILLNNSFDYRKDGIYMTDLSKGIIKFKEMAITCNTTKREFLNCFSAIVSPASSDKLIYLNQLLTIDNTRFGAIFIFNENENISSLQLIPYIQYKSEKWDRLGQQKERREFCDKWLSERLGIPHKTVSGDIEYSFANCRISSFSNFDVRDAGNAGYITIVYK